MDVLRIPENVGSMKGKEGLGATGNLSKSHPRMDAEDEQVLSRQGAGDMDLALRVKGDPARIEEMVQYRVEKQTVEWIQTLGIRTVAPRLHVGGPKKGKFGQATDRASTPESNYTISKEPLADTTLSDGELLGLLKATEVSLMRGDHGRSVKRLERRESDVIPRGKRRRGRTEKGHRSYFWC